MRRHTVSVTSTLPVAADRVYATIADYRDGHPRILPPRYFKSLDVEEGGVGAGTIIRFEMTVLGRTRTTRAAISEPEPGRVLVERALDAPIVTTFTVDPTAQGRHARVTIATELETRGGVLGGIERYVVTKTLERIYRDELALLARVSAGAEA